MTEQRSADEARPPATPWGYWRDDAEPVEVAPGLYLPSLLEAHDPILYLQDDGNAVRPKESQEVTYRGVFRLEGYRYILRALTVWDSTDTGITSTSLRDAALGRLLIYESVGVARVNDGDGLKRYDPRERSDVAAMGPTDEALREVARLYAAVYAFRQKATASVEHAFGLKRSTAENWVRRAKDKGYVFAEA